MLVIPSIGPPQLAAFGLMIAIGVVAAVSLAGRRLERTRACATRH